MTYELDGKDYTDVVTKDYYYTAYLNRGAVLLNTYNFHQKYAYNFEISNTEEKVITDNMFLLIFFIENLFIYFQLNYIVNQVKL